MIVRDGAFPTDLTLSDWHTLVFLFVERAPGDIILRGLLYHQVPGRVHYISRAWR